MDTQRLRLLQKLIDRTVKTGGAYYAAQAELNEFCRDVYGTEPGEIDADEIIDSVFGGCGPPQRMAAKEFDRIMTDDMKEEDGS